MTPRDLLDPEIAKAIEVVPFDEVTAEILPSLRGAMPELPLSDAVERIDHVVPANPKCACVSIAPRGPPPRSPACTRCTGVAT